MTPLIRPNAAIRRSRRRGDYRIAASGEARSFIITGGLREGYGDGKCHELSEVVDAHHSWQRDRGVVFGVTIAPCTISYGWPVGDAVECDKEDGWSMSGGVNVQYQAGLSDRGAENFLFDLASFVGLRLGQKRLYVSFMGRDTILERVE